MPLSPAAATDLDIAYGPNPAQMLDVCTPEGPGQNRPAVLLLHGGGWRAGNRTVMEHRCNGFTAHGIVAIPADYRLADGTPGNFWPAQLRDAQLALRWVRANAAKYGIDPAHICAYGESAGGQLALLLGEEGEIAPGDTQSLLPQVSPRADCVVSNAGPADLATLFAQRPGAGRQVLGPLSAAAATEAARGASPLLHVNGSMGPVLLIQGQNDHAVPPEQATQLLAALSQAGVKAWLVTHTGAHVFTAISPSEAGAIWRDIFAFLKARDLPGQGATTEAATLRTP